MTHTVMRTYIGTAAIAAMALGAVSCSESAIDISNPNVAQPGEVNNDPTALQLLATGLFADQRTTRQAQITNTGILGREMYTFTPQEGRNTTNFLIGITVGGVQKLDPAGFANGSWNGQYVMLRDIFNFNKFVAAQATLTEAQKSGALAVAQTFEAMMIFELLQTRDSLGVVVQIDEDPFAILPFVSRDSGYKYVLNALDAAATKLQAAGSAFPFTLPPGFGAATAGANFTTPAGFLQFNRALKAKAAVYYATLGGGTTAWQAALTALGASFLNAGATTKAQFDVGPVDTYAPGPDTPNGLTQATNTNLYAHMSIQTDAQLKANGQPDDRYTAKIRTGLPSRQGPSGSSASSTLGFSIWPTQSSPIPIIRNEELILLRAEAKLGTGDKAGAIADLNIVRQNSGGLPASTLTAASSNDQIIDGILYEKRYSLLMEADRWPDVRRYNRLSTLPLDVTTGVNKNFVAKVMPIPQAECLNRIVKGGAFVGPNGQNNCAP
ncbi:MAG TPA: RagB/SusD family nutrient uptake outer membrane protein [Gemmatimonadaceae bacterium]